MDERIDEHEGCQWSKWLNTTADGWRVCSVCGQVQRLLGGQWQAVEAESRPRRSVSRPVMLDEKGNPLPLQWGRKIGKGFYVDTKRLGNVRNYWD